MIDCYMIANYNLISVSTGIRDNLMQYELIGGVKGAYSTPREKA